MPIISRRGEDAYTSPIRHLGPYADEAKAKGKHVFHLNIGNPDIHTPKLALERVKAAAEEKIVPYSPSKGLLLIGRNWLIITKNLGQSSLMKTLSLPMVLRRAFCFPCFLASMQVTK